jgi:hypothetical protein
MLSMLSAMGAMSWVDIPFSVTLNMLPAFLIVVGVCDSIHILVITFRQIDAGMGKHEAIVHALSHSGLAVVMTSVTTAAGLLSFSVAKLEPVAQLGVVAPFGVMLAMAYSLVLLPALVAVLPLGPRKRGHDIGITAVSEALVRLGDAVTARPVAVTLAWAVIVLVAIPGVRMAQFSHDGMKWFPKEDPLRQASDIIDREFDGSGGMEVIIDTGGENGLHDPDVMARIERAMRHTETLYVDGDRVSQTFSLVDIVKETNQALNENRPAFYTVPPDRGLLAQELLLFENSGSDDLEEWTDSQFRTARVSLRLPAGDAMRYPPFIAALERVFREQLGDGFDVEVTGLGALFGRTFAAVNPTMGRSYTIALLIITPLMVLLIGNLRGGLVAMIPNLIPVFLTLGLMGALGIPLDNSSLLVGCIIIGLAVDDTIHFMHKFQRYFRETGNAADAVRRTLETTGSALLFTSLCLGAGFTTMLLAYMVNIVEFGMLALFATVVAFLADVVLAPALMVLVTRRAGASSPR